MKTKINAAVRRHGITGRSRFPSQGFEGNYKQRLFRNKFLPQWTAAGASFPSHREDDHQTEVQGAMGNMGMGNTRGITTRGGT